MGGKKGRKKSRHRQGKKALGANCKKNSRMLMQGQKTGQKVEGEIRQRWADEGSDTMKKKKKKNKGFCFGKGGEGDGDKTVRTMGSESQGGGSLNLQGKSRRPEKTTKKLI